MKTEIPTGKNNHPNEECRPAAKTPSAPAPLVWKCILAPTDLSKPSQHAIYTAVALAQKCGAKLILFHVVQCPACATFDAPPDAAVMMDDARQSLDEIARTVPANVAVETIIRFGTREPAEEIIEEANHLSTDLIVIATHGYSGLARVLLGSTAERVVRHALCPVLVVRRSDNASPETRPPKEVQISFRAN